MEQSKEIQLNWTGLENFIYFCLLFHGYCQILIFARETGNEAMTPLKL